MSAASETRARSTSMAKNQAGSKPTAESLLISSRRYARERVMQTLYACFISEEDINFLCHQIIINDEQLDDAGKEFAVLLATTAMTHREECEQTLTAKSVHWDVERLATIDRAILHMAITELRYFKDIPPKVTIDEAIEIAKRFSTPDSGRFVNGILDAVLDELKADGTLTKRGRGLRNA